MGSFCVFIILLLKINAIYLPNNTGQLEEYIEILSQAKSSYMVNKI